MILHFKTFMRAYIVYKVPRNFYHHIHPISLLLYDNRRYSGYQDAFTFAFFILNNGGF